jgi:2C-methyl-D-erythritol 2,4-cyclodiphosphate synthase
MLRPITSKSQQDDSDINPTEVKVEVTDVNIQDKKNEIAKQIANDLQLARNRVESMIKPVRAAESKLGCPRKC